MCAFPRVLSLLAVAGLAACHEHTVFVAPPQPRLASILVEVYDPYTNLVWVGADVRIVEASLEWSGTTVINPSTDPWLTTRSDGTVTFGAEELAAARVGFVEDAYGRALLEPEPDRDEAFVLLEVAAPGFPLVRVEVQLTWSEPDVFVSIPFSPL